MELTVGCICGAARYKIDNEPLFVHACHCTDCQRFSGSAFVVLLGVPRAQLSVEGDTAKVINSTPSGAGYDANFCPQCATVLWSKYHFVKLPIVAVRGGTLDNPAAAQPTCHIFTRTKQPWVILPQDAPTFEGWLDPQTAWSERSLARMRNMAQSD